MYHYKIAYVVSKDLTCFFRYVKTDLFGRQTLLVLQTLVISQYFSHVSVEGSNPHLLQGVAGSAQLAVDQSVAHAHHRDGNEKDHQI